MAKTKPRKSASASSLKSAGKGSKNTAPSKPEPPKKEMILAIDFGSSQLRGFLLDPRDPQNHTTRHIPVLVFDSACAPLDPQSLSIFGTEASSNPNNLSAKYLMYLMSEKETDNSLRTSYPLSDTILANRNNIDCGQILAIFLTQLKNQLTASHGNVRYNENIVLTIPGHWKENDSPRSLYLSIATEVFGEGNQSDNIHTIADTEALAHYVNFHKPDLLHGREKVLFLEFGAHCMSWSLFAIEAEEGGNNKLVLDETNGVAGGIEMWTHHIEKHISNNLQRRRTSDSDRKIPIAVSDMVRDFRTKIGDVLGNLQGGDSRYNRMFCGGSSPQLNVALTAAELKEFFEEGMKAPIKLAREKLNGLAEMERVGVIISGKCMEAEYVRNALFQHDEEALYGPLPGIDMTKVTYMKDVMKGETMSLQFCNSYGAALSMNMPSKIQEFIDGGAAWAIQVKEKDDPEDQWEAEYIPVVLWKELTKLQCWVNVGDSVGEFGMIRIICDPQFSEREAARAHRRIPKIKQRGYCYDFHTVGELGEGMIWVRIMPVMKPGGLVFRVEFADATSVDRMDPHGYVDSTELSVYFDTGDQRVKVVPDSEHMGDTAGSRQTANVAPAPQAADEEEEEDIYNASPRAAGTSAAPQVKEEEEEEEDNSPALPGRSSRSNTASRIKEEDEDTEDEFVDASEEPLQPDDDEDTDQEMEDIPQKAPYRRQSDRLQSHGNFPTPQARPQTPTRKPQPGHKRSTRETPKTPSQAEPAVAKRQRASTGTGTLTKLQQRAPTPGPSTANRRESVNTLQNIFESHPPSSRFRSRVNLTPASGSTPSLQHFLPVRSSPSSAGDNHASGQSTGSQGGSARPETPDETPTATGSNIKGKGKAVARGGNKKGR